MEPPRFRIACATALLFLFACKSAPEPPVPAPLWPVSAEVGLRAHAGTALAGPAHDPEHDADTVDLDEVWCARFELFALTDRPVVELRSLARDSDLIVALDQADPLAPTLLFGRGTGFVSGEAARALVEELRANSTEEAVRGPFVAALPAGVSVGLEVTSPEEIHEPENFLREYPDLGVVERHFAIELDRGLRRSPSGEESARLALSAQDVAPPPVWLDTEDGATIRGRPPEAPRLQRETVLCREPLVLDGGPFVLVTAARSQTGRASHYAIVIELTREPTEEQRERFEFHRADLGGVLARAREEAVARTRSLTPEEASARALRAAVAALDVSSSPRAALLHLASRAFLAQDLSLVASDETLAAFVDELSEIMRSQSEGDTNASAENNVAWMIERTAHLFLARHALAGTLAPALEAVFLRHAGEAARYPSSLVGLVRASDSPQTLQDKLIAEHRAMLRDANPAVRLRASDWLRARDALPEGFLPFAPRKERDAILERAAAQPQEEAR